MKLKVRPRSRLRCLLHKIPEGNISPVRLYDFKFKPFHLCSAGRRVLFNAETLHNHPFHSPHGLYNGGEEGFKISLATLILPVQKILMEESLT